MYKYFTILVLLFVPSIAFAGIFASSTIPDGFLCPTSAGPEAFVIFNDIQGGDYIYWSADAANRLQFNSNGSFDSDLNLSAVCNVSMTTLIQNGRAYFGYWTSTTTPSGGGAGTTTITNSTTTLNIIGVNATSSLTDNPAQNLFNGLVLFFIGMVFIVWFFRGNLIK